MTDPAPRILCVDDDPLMLTVVEESLRGRFLVDCALSAAEALERLQHNGPYAVMISDRTMPEMNGVELLEQAQKLAPDTVRIMLTGDSEQQAAIEAINRGQVYYFLTKPCPPEQLIEIAASAVNRNRLARAKRELGDPAAAASVALLADVLGTVAPEALSRGQRLRDSMKAFAEHLHCPDADRLQVAALLSQLGCASLPPTVLRRAELGAELLPQEQAILRQVPQFGHDLLCDLPALNDLAKIVLYQHKHFDGSGFPADGLAGEKIPAGARMLKVLLDRTELELNGVVKARGRAAMEGRPGFYDPNLLAENFAALPDFLANSLSKLRPVLPRRAAEVEAGQILVSAAMTRDGVRLLDAGTHLTAITIKRLRQHAGLNELQEPLLVQDPD